MFESQSWAQIFALPEVLLPSQAAGIYKIQYPFVAYRIGDPYCNWSGDQATVKAGSQGPVFPNFLKADFSSYEGFRLFVEDFGLENFAAFEKEDFPYPMRETLRKIRDGKLSFVSRKYLERFFDRIKEKILEEQRIMRVFHEWFVEGLMPTCEYEVEGKRCRASIIESLFLDPVGGLDEGIKNQLNEISTAVRANFRQIRLGVAYLPPTFSILRITGETLTEAHISLDYMFPHERLKTLPSDVRRLLRKKWVEYSKTQKPQVAWAFELDSIVQRCYLEMVDLVQDGAELRTCSNCGNFFVPSRKDEKYCSKFAPQTATWTAKGRRTCKQVGPQLQYRKRLKKEGREDVFKQRKKFLSRIDYLKRVGKAQEYEKVQREYEAWKERTSSKKQDNRREREDR